MTTARSTHKNALEWKIAPPFSTMPVNPSVSIRRAEIGDAPRMAEMHERLSKDSIYYRYLCPTCPTHEHFQDLCSMDEEEGIVLVATVESPEPKIVGIAYFHVEADNPVKAEPAILIEDAYQGCGVGKALLKGLRQFAINLGIREMACYTHPSNFRIASMIQSSGLPFESKYDHGMKSVRVWLDVK
jgi:GNAT superfamily N-acetyltransferase